MLTRISALLIALSTAAILSGCATPPLPKADLSDSESFVTNVDIKNQPLDYKLEIQNRAPEITFRNSLVDDAIVPLKVSEKTSLTIEKDLKKFFSINSANYSSNRKIIAKIEKANIYRLVHPSGNLPVFGLIAAFSDTPIVFDIQVTFEVEENHKVLRSYTYNEQIKTIDNVNRGVELVYQRMISLYREKMFQELAQNFIPRYLSKPRKSNELVSSQ